jgi:hypothetical protein
VTVGRKDLDRVCLEIAPRLAATLHSQLGERMGFTLFIFNFGDPGKDDFVAYVSNTQREDMIKAVEQWLARQKAGLTTDPPGPKLEA